MRPRHSTRPIRDLATALAIIACVAALNACHRDCPDGWSGDHTSRAHCEPPPEHTSDVHQRIGTGAYGITLRGCVRENGGEQRYADGLVTSANFLILPVFDGPGVEAIPAHSNSDGLWEAALAPGTYVFKSPDERYAWAYGFDRDPYDDHSVEVRAGNVVYAEIALFDDDCIEGD